MKSLVAISLFALLVAGPVSIWGTAFDHHCSDSHHGAMSRAMDECHSASCCIMAAPAREAGSAAGSDKLKRSVAAAPERLRTRRLGDAPTHTVGSLVPVAPSPASSQTTPVLLL